MTAGKVVLKRGIFTLGLAEMLREYNYPKFKKMWDFMFGYSTDDNYARGKFQNFTHKFGHWLMHLDNTRIKKFELWVEKYAQELEDKRIKDESI